MSKNISKLRDIAEGLLPPLVDIRQVVLVIDDEFRNLRAFKADFRKPFKVFTALNLDEALFFLRTEKIDIIFCDYKLPKMNGAEILGIISKEYPNIKRVALTGFNTEKTRKEFRDKSNTTEIISKPYARSEVFNSIYSIA